MSSRRMSAQLTMQESRRVGVLLRDTLAAVAAAEAAAAKIFKENSDGRPAVSRARRALFAATRRGGGRRATSRRARPGRFAVAPVPVLSASGRLVPLRSPARFSTASAARARHRLLERAGVRGRGESARPRRARARPRRSALAARARELGRVTARTHRLGGARAWPMCPSCWALLVP